MKLITTQFSRSSHYICCVQAFSSAPHSQPSSDYISLVSNTVALLAQCLSIEVQNS